MIPLVFVHGFLGGSAQWALQREEIGAQHQIITVDLPGFGKNSQLTPSQSIEGFAQWVVDELRAQGVMHYNLIGHSMGGMIAQEIARLDQEHIEKLILYGTGPVGVMPGRFETIAKSKERAIRDGAHQTARHIAATWFLEKENASEFEATAEVAQNAGLEAIAAGLDAMEKWNGVDFLPLMKLKTLILWGDQDRAYQWEQPYNLWRAIPDASLAVVPGCSHAVHAEKPSMFNALVLDFLAEEGA